MECVVVGDVRVVKRWSGLPDAPSPDVRLGHRGLGSLHVRFASPGTDPPQADWSWLRSLS
jgi:hypothetical protein